LVKFRGWLFSTFVCPAELPWLIVIESYRTQNPFTWRAKVWYRLPSRLLHHNGHGVKHRRIPLPTPYT